MSSTIPYGPSYTFPSVIPHKRWNPWSESDRALVVQMDADGVPHSEIEKLFHVKKGHITKSLNTWGVARKNRCIPFSDDEIVLIKEAYYRSGLFQVDLSVLSATLGRGRTTVCYMAGKLGLTNIGKRKLPSNKRDIAQRNKWITNAHPRGMLGKKHSDENKALFAKNAVIIHTGLKRSRETCMKISNHMTKRIIENPSSVYCSSTKGKRSDLKETFFRSCWEANVARILDFNNIRWEYEVKTFIFEAVKRGTRSYTPDFYLPDDDRYIEVKGWWDAKSKTKHARMQKYFPEVQIEIIDAERYKGMAATYAALIPNWERPSEKIGVNGKAIRPDSFLDEEDDELHPSTRAPKAGTAYINGRPVSYGEALRAAGLTQDIRRSRNP